MSRLRAFQYFYIHLSGAALANAPFTLLLLISSLIGMETISNHLSTVQMIAFFTVLLSTTIASMLVTNKLLFNQLVNGGTTGLYAYVMHILLNLWLAPNWVGNIWLFIGYIAGGFIGGILRIIEKKYY